MAKHTISQRKYKELLDEWDVVLPPEPIEEFDETLYARGSQQIDNWANQYLEVISATDELKDRKQRKVYVFILDTAGEFTNQYLQPYADNTLGKVFTGEPSGIDLHGHGTHCAGIVASTHPTAKLGIARDMDTLIRVVPIKVLNDNGAGAWPWIEAGIRYVTALNITDGVKVISMSLGGLQTGIDVSNAIRDAVNAGVFVFAAAGNNGHNPNQSNVGFPANDPNVIAIASLDITGERSSFSSTGDEVEYASPGRDIWSTWKSNTLASLSGTSMACPNAVGISAWILSIYDDIKSQEELRTALEAEVTDLGTPGRDIYFGHGVNIITPYLDEPVPDPDPDPDPDPTPDPEPIDPPNRSVLDWVTLGLQITILILTIYIAINI